MLKIDLDFKFFKFIEKNIKILFQPNLTLFLTPKSKEFFLRLKKTFGKNPVLQHFDVSKLIRLKINVFAKTIGGVICQQDRKINWHPVIYYSCKTLLAERNYETHDAELLTIVEGFQTWRYYLKKTSYTILVLTYYKNPNKFIEKVYWGDSSFYQICQFL